jgi:uncharacterized protein involved in tolerance to divalent cations
MRGGDAPQCHPESRRWHTTADGAEAVTKLKLKLAELGAQNVQTSRIQSFYWWTGKVQNEAEELISFESSRPFDEIVAAVCVAHSYDTPMIVSESDDAQSSYWKGTVDGGTAAMAQALTEARLVACAQLSASTLTVKTVADAKALIAAKLGSIPVAWQPINGNRPYLDWMSAETDPALRS